MIFINFYLVGSLGFTKKKLAKLHFIFCTITSPIAPVWALTNIVVTVRIRPR